MGTFLNFFFKMMQDIRWRSAKIFCKKFFSTSLIKRRIDFNELSNNFLKYGHITQTPIV